MQFKKQLIKYFFILTVFFIPYFASAYYTIDITDNELISLDGSVLTIPYQVFATDDEASFFYIADSENLGTYPTSTYVIASGSYDWGWSSISTDLNQGGIASTTGNYWFQFRCTAGYYGNNCINDDLKYIKLYNNNGTWLLGNINDTFSESSTFINISTPTTSTTTIINITDTWLQSVNFSGSFYTSDYEMFAIRQKSSIYSDVFVDVYTDVNSYNNSNNFNVDLTFDPDLSYIELGFYDLEGNFYRYNDLIYTIYFDPDLVIQEASSTIIWATPTPFDNNSSATTTINDFFSSLGNICSPFISAENTFIDIEYNTDFDIVKCALGLIYLDTPESRSYMMSSLVNLFNRFRGGFPMGILDFYVNPFTTLADDYLTYNATTTLSINFDLPSVLGGHDYTYTLSSSTMDWLWYATSTGEWSDEQGLTFIETVRVYFDPFCYFVFILYVLSRFLGIFETSVVSYGRIERNKRYNRYKYDYSYIN